MAMASAVLACLILITFLFLQGAISSLIGSSRLREHSQAALAASNRLERLVFDLDSGQRGYLITGDPAFLRPWNTALSAYPAQTRDFQRLAARAGDRQGRHAAEIVRATDSYVHDYSVPLVNRSAPAVRGQSVQAAAEGRQRIGRLRTEFDRFIQYQRGVEAGQQRHAMDQVRRAALTAAGAALGLVFLILLFTGYLARAVMGPVRRASVLAGRLAHGDLTVRMPETALAEVGTLERAFNIMAGSLEESRERICQAAGDQTALRRVATLVARAVSPEEMFDAVAGELGQILGADLIVISRFELDRMETVVGTWKPATSEVPVPAAGSCWSLEGRSLESAVLVSGAPARATGYQHATSGIGVWARTRGISSAVGVPVVVEGRLWGTIIAFSTGPEAPTGTEGRMMEFTELVGTALANAENQAKLAAARARLVAAADETRRRIERDLHDGAQQRLVSLGLELRAAEGAVPAEQQALRERLSRTARGLTDVLEDLQEISRGLHPAILSRAGLEPALRTFARRAAVPVELRMEGTRRLDEGLEAAIYYIVTEAVTGAIKNAHASVVSIELAVEDAAVRLSVADDGSGRTASNGEQSLITLKDRVAAIGGTLEITTPPGGGMRLGVRIPAPPS
jgi:signal transduction histidine kinase